MTGTPTPGLVATAHLMLTQLGVSLADLQDSTIRHPPAPGMSEYLPRVIAAASPSSNRLYGPYLNRMARPTCRVVPARVSSKVGE